METEVASTEQINESNKNTRSIEQDIESGNLTIHTRVTRYYNDGTSDYYNCSYVYNTLSNGIKEGYGAESGIVKNIKEYAQQVNIYNNNKTVLVSDGYSADIEVNNVLNYCTVTAYSTNNTGTLYFMPGNILRTEVRLYDVNNNVTVLSNDVGYSVQIFEGSSKKSISFKLNLDNVSFDVYNVELKFFYSKTIGYNQSLSYYQSASDYDLRMYSGYDNSIIDISVNDGSVSLLKSLLTWITGIYDKINDTLSNVKNGFNNVVSALLNLPNLIIDGIKSLFIPSEDDIASQRDKWINLLSSHFGALYEVVELIDNYADTFEASEQKFVEFPKFELELVGSTFTFGGQNVKVVPDGFEVLINALKLIISILVTCLFVNGLRNRFEKLIGGNNAA